MDVDLLAKIIGDLVLDNSEVGLPGLGTFVVEMVPASFSDRGYTINPPYKRLSFHPGRGDDNLLVDFYARSNGIDSEAAKVFVNDFLRELKEILKTRKTVVLPGLGRLRATKENNFFFVSDENLDIFPDGYALEPVSLKTHQESPREISQMVDSLASIVTSPMASEPDPEPVLSTETPVESGEVSSVDSGEVLPEESGEVLPEESLSIEATSQSVDEQSAEVQSQSVDERSEEAQSQSDSAIEESLSQSVDEQSAESPSESDNASEESPSHIVDEQSAEVQSQSENEQSAEVQSQSENEQSAEASPLPSEEVCGVSDGARVDAGGVRESRARRRRIIQRVFVVILSVVIAVALALAVFLILAKVAPDFIDSLLYTPEELRIINY
ncbi:MAG: hypothetical protein PUB45_02030 [Bacteroidales bacterium]|nr:hypothetical protein [Bacteroidales bacterium]